MEAASEQPRYQLRRLTSADAAGVAELALHVNGTRYFHDEVYHPDRLLALNAAGEVITVVAADEGGRVVGQYALLRPELGPVAETAEAMVLPEHRGHGLLNLLRGRLEEEGVRLGLMGLEGMPVTHHVYSQKVYEHFHCHPGGVQFGIAPASSMHTDVPLTQRVTMLHYFKYLHRPAQVVGWAPPRHQEILQRIYGSHGVAVKFEGATATAGAGQLTAKPVPRLELGLIRVRQVGADSAAAIIEARRRLLADGARVVYLELPLNQAGMPDLCEKAERAGFFFSCLRPGAAENGDALQLQYLTEPLDSTLVQVESPAAQELVAYALAERERVASWN